MNEKLIEIIVELLRRQGTEPAGEPEVIVLTRTCVNANGTRFEKGEILARNPSGQYHRPGEFVGGPCIGLLGDSYGLNGNFVKLA